MSPTYSQLIKSVHERLDAISDNTPADSSEASDKKPISALSQHRLFLAISDLTQALDAAHKETGRCLKQLAELEHRVKLIEVHRR